MQTAVEWLVEQLEIFATEQEMNIIEKAKEMEKEQIKDAYENGLYDGDGRNRSNYNMNAEQYYNETFKSE